MTDISDHDIQPEGLIEPGMDLDTVLNLDEDDYLNSQAIVDHLIWFTEHPSISKDAFSDMLRIQHFYTLLY